MDKITDYLQFYKEEYGARKLRKIESEVYKSRRFNDFISQSYSRNILPSPKDFYGCIMNSIKYSFASKYTLIATALILLLRWNDEVNIHKKLRNVNDIKSYAEVLMQEGNSLGM